MAANFLSYVTVTCLVVLSTCGAVYNSNHENETSNKKSVTFKNDQDINNYLRMYDTDVMLWRCRNAITRNWDRKPIPYVDLYCEVLGKVKSIDVFHNWQKMKYKKQYTILVAPHFANGRYYSRWLDFRVRLHNVTRKNTGSYIVRIKSPYGNMEMQMIFLDVAHTKQPRRNKHENETKPRKNRKRRRRRRRRKKEE